MDTADRPILPATRAVAAALVPILLAASVGLYGWPGSTEAAFAWTIKPDATPLLMGAGYASGVVFFFFVWRRATRWLEVSFGFVGVGVFATLMGIATIIHWDRFNHDHPTFWGWVALYVTTPALVAGLWLYNGAWRPPPPGKTEPRLPGWARVALGLLGGATFAAGLAVFVHPQLAIDHWGWDVSPLTARVVASFTTLAIGWGAPALDGRRAAFRITALSQLVGFALLLLGLLRAHDDLHTGRPVTWIYLGAVGASFLLLAWLLADRRPSPGRDAVTIP